jgi:hypothetical protein
VHLAWNGVTAPDQLAPAWTALIAHMADWRSYSAHRCAEMAAEPDLATRLMAFIRARLPATYT